MEKASDRAAALTFGPRPSHHGDYSAANGYRGAAATLEAVHDHDEAHSEGTITIMPLIFSAGAL